MTELTMTVAELAARDMAVASAAIRGTLDQLGDAVPECDILADPVIEAIYRAVTPPKGLQAIEQLTGPHDD